MAVGQGRGCAEDVLGPRIFIPGVNRVNHAVGCCVLIGCLRLVRVRIRVRVGVGVGLRLGVRIRG